MKSVRFWSLLLIVSFLGAGCHRSSAEDRNNRRLLEEILTAATLTNGRLLEDAAKRGKERHDTGKIADDDYQAMEAIINKGRAKDWSGALADGYAFRKARPFVRFGQ